MGLQVAALDMLVRLSTLDPRPLTMNLSWFTSRTVRHAGAMRKHVQNLLNSQRDILSPQAADQAAEAACVRARGKRACIQAGMGYPRS